MMREEAQALTKVLRDVAEVTLVLEPRSSSRDVVGRAGMEEQERISARALRENGSVGRETDHFPRTLMRHFIDGSSAGPFSKKDGKGASTSSRSEVGEMTISVSGDGSGELLGL